MTYDLNVSFQTDAAKSAPPDIPDIPDFRPRHRWPVNSVTVRHFGFGVSRQEPDQFPEGRAGWWVDDNLNILTNQFGYDENHD